MKPYSEAEIFGPYRVSREKIKQWGGKWDCIVARMVNYGDDIEMMEPLHIEMADSPGIAIKGAMRWLQFFLGE